MSLKSKIEAVIYASEEPVTLTQLVVLLSEEAQSELDALAARQAELPLDSSVETPGSNGADEPDGNGYIEPAISDSDSADSASAPERIDSAGIFPETTITAESARVPEKAFAIDGPDEPAGPSPEADKRQVCERERAIREYLRGMVGALIREYADTDRGLEIREVAGGFRFGTKPEYHDAVRGFVKSLKPALKLSLQALETLAVVAYKQPVTAAEISEIRGVDSAGVLGGLLTRKLIQTAGRKQVIGRPMLYKTTKEFLIRFGLRDIQELPSMEEFERMAGELAEQEDLPMEATEHVIERANARGDAEHIRETNEAATQEGVFSGETGTAFPAEESGETAQDINGASPEDASGEQSSGRETEDGSDQVESSPRAEAEPSAAEEEPA